MHSRELGTVTYSGHDEDGFPVVGYDSHGETGERGKVGAFELHHPFGFYSMPRDPEVDKATGDPIPGRGCNLWVEDEGEEYHGTLGFDPRYLPDVAKPTKGSSMQYSSAGSFHILDGDDGTSTLYVPVGDDKAHVFTMGLDGNKKPYVGVVQSNGLAVTMLDKSLVIKNASGNAYIELNDDGIVLSGNLRIVGGVVMGSAEAEPLVKAPELIAQLTKIFVALDASFAHAVPPITGVFTDMIGELAALAATLTKGT